MKNLNENRLALIVPKRNEFRFTFGILGAANWSYQWFNPNGTLTDREVAEVFVEMILEGIQSV
jgi:TetR/AcrR family transcriptional regulator, cholesterol catabolism regulator